MADPVLGAKEAGARNVEHLEGIPERGPEAEAKKQKTKEEAKAKEAVPKNAEHLPPVHGEEKAMLLEDLESQETFAPTFDQRVKAEIEVIKLKAKEHIEFESDPQSVFLDDHTQHISSEVPDNMGIMAEKIRQDVKESIQSINKVGETIAQKTSNVVSEIASGLTEMQKSLADVTLDWGKEQGPEASAGAVAGARAEASAGAVAGAGAKDEAKEKPAESKEQNAQVTVKTEVVVDGSVTAKAEQSFDLPESKPAEPTIDMHQHVVDNHKHREEIMEHCVHIGQEVETIKQLETKED